MFHAAVPDGVTSMKYIYSHFIEKVEFQVIVNKGPVLRQHTGNAVSCETDRIQVSAGDEVKFRCAVRQDKGACTIDQIKFNTSGNKPCMTDSPIAAPTARPNSKAQHHSNLFAHTLLDRA